MKIFNPVLVQRYREAKACELCGKATPGGTDPMHVMARGRDDAFRMDLDFNLLAGCRGCHTKAHWGVISRRDQLAVIAKREGVDLDSLEIFLLRLRHA